MCTVVSHSKPFNINGTILCQSYDQPRQNIKKQRHYFANKCPSSQSYFFFPVVMYGCESWIIKKDEHWKMDTEIVIHTHTHTHTQRNIQFSHSVVSDPLRSHGLQHPRPPCPASTPRVYSNSHSSSWWCHPAISSPVLPFSSCLQSFPASGSFEMSPFFASGDQSIRVSPSASVLPMTIQDWSPLGLTGWISLQSKGLSRVFSNTTFQNHQFFGIQLSL